MLESTLGIGTLPPQTDVYVPRRLSQDDLAREYLRPAEPDGRGLVPAQVLYVGVAQEKQKVFRTIKRRNPVTRTAYPWLAPSTAVVNQYYFYCVDGVRAGLREVLRLPPYAGRLILNRQWGCPAAGRQGRRRLHAAG
jgi:hypothetical protein